jgi:hypothetical protein
MGESIMTRASQWMMTLAVLAGGLVAHQAMAQQPASRQVVRSVPAQVRTVQPTRSYRSYSVNPARGDVRRNGPHSGEATWRHAGAKPAGHYSNGR